MNEQTKKGFQILLTALILGVLGNIMLREVPWGLNVLLFNAAFTAGMIALLRRYKPEFLTGRSYALFGAQIFFASMFVWRDSIELRIADSMAILAVLSALFLPRMGLQTQLAGVFHYAAGFVWSSFNAVFAPFALVFSDIEWADGARSGWSKHLFSVLRGVAIAAPILLIFGGLFAASDAVFEGLVERVFNVMPETVFTHILLTSIFAWLSAGYLRGVMTEKRQPVDAARAGVVPKFDPNLSKVENIRAEQIDNPDVLPDNLSILEHINKAEEAESRPVGSALSSLQAEKEKKHFEWSNFENTVLPPAFTLGAVEIGVILGLTNLLFLSFVIVQVPYLFGGIELVQNTPDFKLAEYARRGFGELVTVAGLVLPVLLASHWLIRKDNPSAGRLFRIFAGIQIVLLFIIMASAAQRLVLLTGNLGYGLTTVRLYPMIFMIWLAVVFVWFGVTVLRGARKHFAWGALWSAFLLLGAAHVINPDAFIVRTNIRLMHEGRDFDSAYNASLSDDALPVLINSFESLDTFDQQISIDRIAKSYCEKSQKTDLRSWNYSRWQAGKLLNSNPMVLNKIGDCRSVSE